MLYMNVNNLIHFNANVQNNFLIPDTFDVNAKIILMHKKFNGYA